MQLKTKQQGLLEFLTVGMLAHGRQDTLDQLGDRSQYIGMSDIGKALECLRSAVADKSGIIENIQPQAISGLSHEKIKQVLIKQITLQRGHWQEYGIQKAITSTRAHCIPQLEISMDYRGVPLKAHLDFTIVRDRPHPAVRILELKSNEHIPDNLYASYEAQIYGQTGLLHHCWNRPCFSVPPTGHFEGIVNATFPEVAQSMFDIQLPDNPEEADIQAWVLSISMSDIKPFGPYTHDPSMLQTCFDKAEQLWNEKTKLLSGAISLNDIDHCFGFHPLCDFCSVNAGCPKFQSQFLAIDPDCDAALKELADLKSQESTIQKKKKELEQRVKNTYRAIQGDNTGWLNTSGYRFKVATMPGRKSFDRDVLHEKLTEHICDEISVDDVLGGCQKTSQPYERLYVSQVNR
ncbi:hypothetical protein FCL47_16080 [Desulfopila sp. IMCC35006]|uniref:hypothetical protein n=1 Tax=Desulfopila sp. IMCC35006 TaxID=2569542 RepID=UPI0010AC2327|nr:hypothetical protein [Desulfopila sp. IMCC35006]TKB25161.1 hypothetical protein FCL47_16080 [Desulfopila sp. IMCC35006]